MFTSAKDSTFYLLCEHSEDITINEVCQLDGIHHVVLR